MLVSTGASLFNEVALSGSLLYLMYQRRSGFRESDSILKRIAWLISSSAILIVVYGTCTIIVACVSPRSFANIAIQSNASKCMSCFSFKYLGTHSILTSLHYRHVCIVSLSGHLHFARDDMYLVLRLNSRRRLKGSPARSEANENEVVVHLEQVRVVDYAVTSDEGRKDRSITPPSSSGTWAGSFVNMS